MTNFELITQNPRTLDDFLSAVQDDALEAEGCSFDLNYPPHDNDDPEMPRFDWDEWLEQEAEDDMVRIRSCGMIRPGDYEKRLDEDDLIL